MDKNTFKDFILCNEIHCFVIWNKGLKFKDEILKDINSKFNVVFLKIIKWDKNTIKTNLQNLYEWNFPYADIKVDECGYGKFLFIIVKDMHPVYVLKKPYKKWVSVNKKMYECKYLYRNICKANLVHATNDKKEAIHDLLFFFDLIKNDNNFKL